MSLPAPPGRKPKQDNAGGCLGPLSLLLVAGVIWLLVITWPWWLLVPPLLTLFFLIKTPESINKTKNSFLHEEVDSQTASFRSDFMVGLFAFGTLSAAICIFTIGLDNLEWWLIPLLAFSMAIRLRALSAQPGNLLRFRRALYDNIFELTVLAGVVLVGYSLAVVKLQTAPLDSMTLQSLMDWDDRVQRLHEWLENHASSFAMLLVILLVIFAMRLAASGRPSLTGAANIIAKWLAGAVKWLGRLSTLTAVAASLTFLATDTAGPAGSIGLKLRDAKADYSHFERVLGDKTDQMLRNALVLKAWTTAPPSLRQQLMNSARFQKERDKFEQMQGKAQRLFDIHANGPEGFPESVKIAPKKQNEDKNVSLELPLSLTPLELRQAADAADEFAAKPDHDLEGIQEAKDDITKEAFEKISPAEHLFDDAPFISLLKSHYPVVGEFIDAINSSISEAAFDAIRNAVVRDSIDRKAAPPYVPLEVSVPERITAAIGDVHLGMDRFNDVWLSKTEQSIDGYRSAVRSASDRLEAEASDRQRNQVETAYRSINEPVRLLAELGDSLGTAQLTEKAHTVQRAASELVQLGTSWPALVEPNAKLQDRMSTISKGIQDDQLFEYHYGDLSYRVNQLRGPTSGSDQDLENEVLLAMPKQALALMRPSPLMMIESLRSFCEEKITEVVSASNNSAADKEKIHRVLGDRYFLYFADAENQLRQADEERKREEREVEEQRRRDYERQRQQRQTEQELHEVEHPAVEAP